MKQYKTNPKAKRVERMEQRDPIQQVVPLMNYYHSLPMKFFPTESARTLESLHTRDQIMDVISEAQISPGFRQAIVDALDSKKYWDSIRDRMF